MSKAEKKNIAMSVRMRLLNLSRETCIDFMKLLTRYLQERLLYRIAISSHRQHLLLKGSSLLYAHHPFNARPTVDIDLLGQDWSNNETAVSEAFRQICSLPCEEDGVIFDAESLQLRPIAIEKKYPGLCVIVEAHLDSIRQPISVDIGFGDVVTPSPVFLTYPVLLDDVPQPQLWAYSLESSIAEKFHAMIERDSQNSRMKDFYDLYTLFTEYDVDDSILKMAVHDTFLNRGTHYVENAALFNPEFATDTNRVKQWNAFLKKIKYPDLLPLDDVVKCICEHMISIWTPINIE